MPLSFNCATFSIYMPQKIVTREIKYLPIRFLDALEKRITDLYNANHDIDPRVADVNATTIDSVNIFCKENGELDDSHVNANESSPSYSNITYHITSIVLGGEQLLLSID